MLYKADAKHLKDRLPRVGWPVKPWLPGASEGRGSGSGSGSECGSLR